MARLNVRTCILIESPPGESDEELKGYVVMLLKAVYGHIPDWLEFQIGQRVEWRHLQFREFICIAGSVSAQIILRAGRPNGVGRPIIVLGKWLNDEPASKHILNGIETEFDSAELRVI